MCANLATVPLLVLVVPALEASASGDSARNRSLMRCGQWAKLGRCTLPVRIISTHPAELPPVTASAACHDSCLLVADGVFGPPPPPPSSFLCRCISLAAGFTYSAPDAPVHDFHLALNNQLPLALPIKAVVLIFSDEQVCC